MVALVYWCMLFVEMERFGLALCALIAGMLSHELASIGGVYVLCRLAGTADRWPDRW